MLYKPHQILQAAKEAVKSGKSVVSDNTNPSKAARKEFIDIAKKSGNLIHIVCPCFCKLYLS